MEVNYKRKVSMSKTVININTTNDNVNINTITPVFIFL